jgi:hypothetical protein
VRQPERRGPLDVGRDGPAPPRQPQVTEGPGAGQRHVGPDVGHLVEQEREADLRLRHAQPAQVEVDHRLAELGQPGPRGLHAVAVGDIEEMNGRHPGPPLVSYIRSVIGH